MSRTSSDHEASLILAPSQEETIVPSQLASAVYPEQVINARKRPDEHRRGLTLAIVGILSTLDHSHPEGVPYVRDQYNTSTSPFWFDTSQTQRWDDGKCQRRDRS